MKELSLNVLDIAKNSVKAGADSIAICLSLDGEGVLSLTVTDNGCGMTEDVLHRVTDPFYTTRTTRKVGLGLPLLRLAAEQTGGHLSIRSSTAPADHGTELCAVFHADHIDCAPIGDMPSSICALVAGSPDIHWHFSDCTPSGEVTLDTDELHAVLGENISLAEPEIQMWMREYLAEQYAEREKSNTKDN